MEPHAAHNGTSGDDYTARLTSLSDKRWKTVLDVQRPYRWNLRRLVEGEVLDVGCGVGRNLLHLGGRGVGVDHNPTSVATCRDRGLEAYTAEDFHAGERARPGAFGTLLLAHVVEHVPRETARALLQEYLPYLRTGGVLVLVCPQEAGYRSDPTHVEFVDLPDLVDLAQEAGLRLERRLSFPFPRPVGRVFTYNESVVTARNLGGTGPTT